MKFRTDLAAVGVLGAALAQWPVYAVGADAPEGAGAGLGNWLNSGYGERLRAADPQGLSPNRQPASRTPTGLLYDIPYLVREPDRSTSNWDYSAYLEVGVLGGDVKNRSVLFRGYRDPGNELQLSAFGLDATKADEARFVEITGGGLGRNDQFYAAQFGRYNDYRFKLFFSETPRTYSTTAKPVWDGVGTGNLTLPVFPGIAPGGGSASPATNADAVRTLFATKDVSELKVVRSKGGMQLEMNLSDAWKVFASYAPEKRKGARPFGGGWDFGGNNGNAEIVEPIDYQTHELLAALRFADPLTQFNLTLAASLFRNDVDALIWENPFRVTSGGLTIPQGRIELAPNNEAYNAKAEYARALPSFRNGRVTATVAFGSMRQNDSLLPPTITRGTSLSFNFDNWNTRAALSQQNANARIGTRLADFGLSLQPLERLTVRGKLRHYATQNDTRYTAFNPITGQYGYVGLDGIPSVFTGTQNIRFRSIPVEYQQLNYGVAAEYALRGRSVLTANYEREEFRRSHRERDRTWEDRLKLSYTDRGFDSATLRISYQYGDRRGSRYNGEAYADFYVASLPGYVDTAGNAAARIHVLEELRRFDLADRRQHVLNGRINYMLGPDLDLGATLQAKLYEFPASFGRSGQQTQNSFNLDLNYRPAADAQSFAFYSRQSGRMRQAGVADLGSAAAAGCAVLPPSCSASFAAPLSLYPADRSWEALTKDRVEVLGLGVRKNIGPARLDAQYTRTSHRSPLSYAYASAAALAGGATVAQAGNAFPELTYKLDAIDASLRVPLTKLTAMRLYYRFENGRLFDWRYSALEQSTVVGGRVYLDAGPQNYRVQVLGAFLQLML